MLIVVYLHEAKQYTVVPEEFIFCLDERSLKNYGVNSNQTRLIYFSKEAYEKLEQNVKQTFAPNFNLPVTNVYPLPDNLEETCFKGHMYAFESKFFYNITLFFLRNIQNIH